VRSLSIIVPALNEAAHLQETIYDLLPVARASLDTFEIIIINDGSTDLTGIIAEELSKELPEVRCIHHQERRGLAAGFRSGVNAAHQEFLVLVPGDNAYFAASLHELFASIGNADLIIGYRTNQGESRRWFRVLISKAFNTLFGLVMGHSIKDVHGMPIYRLSMLRKMRLRSSNYSHQLESMACMLRRGARFIEIPVVLNPDLKGSSRALRLKTFIDVAQTYWLLIFNRDDVC
jgi:dolichol-phosphate mannosyltransferase